MATDTGPDRQVGDDAPPVPQPRGAAVTFVTTEHFVLQTARSATITESTGRATMFLSALSGGLVALGLIATATRVGAAFYAFGLILLPTLTFLGLVTFQRSLQTGVQDLGYAQRIARVRAYYFRYAPELSDYLLDTLPTDRRLVQGFEGPRWQSFVTVAGMVAVVTAVLGGSTIGLLIWVLSRSLGASVSGGVVVGLGIVVLLLLYQDRTWLRANRLEMFSDEGSGPPPPPSMPGS